jgi:hypothetical protein
MSTPSPTLIPTIDPVLQYFHYYASDVGAIVLIVLYGLTAIAGFVNLLRYPRAKYMAILVFSACLECAGYGTRYLSILKPTLSPFIISVLFILLSPIFLALLNYITVSKLVDKTDITIACIKPSIMSYVFFASDFAGLIIQGIGGSVLASAKTQSAFDLGSAIILAGLAIQVGFFTIFTYIMLTAAFGKKFKMYERDDLKTAFNVLIFTTIMIYIRNIFRLIEYAVPHDSYIPTHEWLFFAFESAPILLACIVYCGWSFGRILPDEYLTPVKVFLDKDVFDVNLNHVDGESKV